MKDWNKRTKLEKGLVITGGIVAISGITIGLMILGNKYFSKKVSEQVAIKLAEESNKILSDGIRLGSEAAKHWYSIGKSSGVKDLMGLLESIDFTDPKILQILKDKGIYAILDIAVRSRKFTGL